MFCPLSWCQAYSVESLWKTQSRPIQPRECQLFRVTCCLSDKIHTQSGSGNWHCPDCMIRSHTYAHLCIHIRIHAYSLSYVQLYIVFFLNTYTQSIWIIHRCLLLLKASARCSTYTLRKLLFSSFRHSDIFGFSYRFHLNVPPKLHHKWRGTWRTFNHANVFYCTIYIHLIYPFLHAVMCIKYHRWKKCTPGVLAMHFREFSVEIQRVSAPVAQRWGLRVHNSVRCNYEKLIPGKPVWHWLYDVSYSYLIQSSVTVQPCTWIYGCMHTFCEHKASDTHNLADSSRSLVIVSGVSCLR